MIDAIFVLGERFCTVGDDAEGIRIRAYEFLDIKSAVILITEDAVLVLEIIFLLRDFGESRRIRACDHAHGDRFRFESRNVITINAAFILETIDADSGH